MRDSHHDDDAVAADLARFRAHFDRLIDSLHLSRGMSTRASAAALRKLVRSGAVLFDDVERRPERFFEAHRALARATATTLGPGFWIRFTVTYNLCFGTVQALGTRAHRRRAREARARGALGCFCLTERLAGVNSGLVVNTTATWDQGKQRFVIESGAEGGTKNWISNGFRADSAVVVANLIVGGEARGPHGFYVDLRPGVRKRLARGIAMGDMGVKTTANDLDNFWIRFDGFEAPRDSLLSKYGGVDFETGEYRAETRGGASTMDMIGQRLYTGRVAVAQAALAFTRRLYDDTKTYSDAKTCVMRGSSPYLSDVPQLRALYAEGYAVLDRLDKFVARCERDLCEHLRARTIPNADLTRAIAVSKIKAVEASIDLSFRLKQEVGSYALMAGTGFDNTDFLQCCKFAEGDSRILSQKLARDCFGAYKRGDDGGVDGPRSEIEVELCRRVDAVVNDARAANPNVHKIDAWDCAWREVYELAEVICERVMHERSVDAEVLRSKL